MSITYSQAVEQTITAGEQIHQIVNGTATTEVTVEDGSKVPSIRKALLDNLYFKDPVAWQVGQTENVFNQLRQFTDGSWWYAPSATSSNPVNMNSTPMGDQSWKLYPLDPYLRQDLAAPGGAGLVGFGHSIAYAPMSAGRKLKNTISVTDAPFNATGDGVTDDTLAIRSAVAHMKSIGGGTLHFPKGTYLVHVANPNYASSTLNAYAINIDFNNIHLTGDGAGATILKCISTQCVYGVIHLGKIPILNGTNQIFNCSVTNMTIDGNNTNPAPTVGTRQPVILAGGLVNSTFSDLHIKDSGMYGIGLQNGGHDSVIIDRIFFENCGRNAIDVKNNGSVNRAILMSNLIVKHCGWVNFDDNASSCLSVTGEGCQLENITFLDIPTGPDSIGRVLRIKPGSEGFSQGVGARATTVNNIQILLGATASPSIEHAIEVGCEKARLSNIVIRGAVPVGISAMQPWTSISNCLIDGPTVGIEIRQRKIAPPTQMYDSAYDTIVTGCHIMNCSGNGISINALRAIITGNVIDTCGIGINATGFSGADLTIVNNRLLNCTTPLRGDSSSSQHWYGNAGAINPMFDTILENNEAKNLVIKVENTLRVAGASGGHDIAWFRSIVGAVNKFDIYPSLANNPILLAASGADVNIDIKIQPKGNGKVLFPINSIPDYADNTAAATAGVPLGGMYRTGGSLKVRI